jgi:hypothetical protein
MNFKEKLTGATGKLRIVIQDETTGEVKHDFETTNLVVDTGLDFIASRMTGTSATVMTHMAIGDDDTAAAPGDTQLGSQLGSRKGLSVSGGTATDNAVEYVASFNAGEGTGPVTEAGIFNASTSGTMLCRTVFDVINKGASDSMTITWTVTVS